MNLGYVSVTFGPAFTFALEVAFVSIIVLSFLRNIPFALTFASGSAFAFTAFSIEVGVCWGCSGPVYSDLQSMQKLLCLYGYEKAGSFSAFSSSFALRGFAKFAAVDLSFGVATFCC